MPLRKRIGIMGVGCWSASRVSNPLLCAMLRNVLPIHHRHNKPLFRGLSVVTRGEFTQRFRLSQAYAYIIPRFLAPKLAKFQKKKRPLLAANCFPLFFFVIRLEDPLVSLYIADTVFCDRDDRLTIHVDVSIFRRRRKLDSLCQFNQLVYALSSSSLTTRTRPY